MRCLHRCSAAWVRVGILGKTLRGLFRGISGCAGWAPFPHSERFLLTHRTACDPVVCGLFPHRAWFSRTVSLRLQFFAGAVSWLTLPAYLFRHSAKQNRGSRTSGGEGGDHSPSRAGCPCGYSTRSGGKRSGLTRGQSESSRRLWISHSGASQS